MARRGPCGPGHRRTLDGSSRTGGPFVLPPPRPTGRCLCGFKCTRLAGALAPIRRRRGAAGAGHSQYHAGLPLRGCGRRHGRTGLCPPLPAADPGAGPTGHCRFPRQRSGLVLRRPIQPCGDPPGKCTQNCRYRAILASRQRPPGGAGARAADGGRRPGALERAGQPV